MQFLNVLGAKSRTLHSTPLLYLLQAGSSADVFLSLNFPVSLACGQQKHQITGQSCLGVILVSKLLTGLDLKRCVLNEVLTACSR